MKKAIFTRWMSHEKAVTSILKTYKALLMDLENAVVSKEQANGNSVTADGLLKNLKSYKTYLGFCWLSDVMSILTTFNLHLEEEEIDIGDLEAQLAITLSSLNRMKKDNGLHVRKAEKNAQEMGLVPDDQTKDSVQKSYRKWIPELIEAIESRMDNSDIIFAFSALDLSKPVKNQSILPQFGNAKLSQLADFFKIDDDEVTEEWVELCTLVKNVHSDLNPLESMSNLFKFILNREKLIKEEQFKNIKFLLSVGLIFPLSTACVERTFSQVKRIVTAARNSLNVKRVSDFLMIKFRTPSDETFEKAAKYFLEKKKRRITCPKKRI